MIRIKTLKNKQAMESSCVRRKGNVQKMMRACHKDTEPTCRGSIGQIWINLNTRIIKYSNYRPLRKSRNLGISNHNKQIHGEEERVIPYTGMPSTVSYQGGRKIVILQLLQMFNVGYIVE